MPRDWTYQDSDEYNLPEGIQRVGYDADTQTYTYRSSNGATYQGLPGNRYGRLIPTSEVSDGAEYERHGQVVDNRAAWRYMFPFFLLVMVFLFLVIAPPWSWRRDVDQGPRIQCGAGTIAHEVKGGDTCYDIAQTFSTSVDELKRLNTDLDCDRLQIGSRICVPGSN